MINNVSFPQLGIELEVNRVAFSIGGVNIYWYGICIALGMLLAIVFVLKKSRSFGVNDDRLIDVIMLSTIVAVVGARAFYVMFAPFEYESIIDMISIRDGGLAIYGAVIMGFGSAVLFTKLRKIPFFPTVDLVAMGFLIGQGIGRWGNFFNQEAFGTNTTSVFGMISESTTAYLAATQDVLAQSGVVIDPSLPVHPTFLYESLWCLLGFVLLAAYSKKRKFNGEIFLLYFIWYGIERAVVEGLRTDSLEAIGGIRVSQAIAVFTALIAFLLWAYFRKKFKDTPLMVSYDFMVDPKDKKSPLVNMKWKASEEMPTQEDVLKAYKKQQEETKEEKENTQTNDEAENKKAEKENEVEIDQDNNLNEVSSETNDDKNEEENNEESAKEKEDK